MPPEELAGLAELAKQQAHKVLGKIPLLGPVTWLMMQQSHSRHTLLSELEWRVMPALILDQAKLYLKDDAPVAFASWARFNQATVQRYRSPPHQLAMADWSSGDQIWLIDVFTPFGGAQDVLKDLREKVFAGQIVHQLIPVPNAVPKVLAWPALQPKSDISTSRSQA
ncbi:toxin-activating lysine-acyltransferase [Polaromonas sp.]|uniref:toxin-activating lysine-acyltransferase n=1 Tax=Polaromonas sp. TaxID=1869339 RepID=UPI003752A0C1